MPGLSRRGGAPRLFLAAIALTGSSWAESCTTRSGSTTETGWWNEECPETPTCTLHSCATQGDAGADAGIACCIAAEGRGLDEKAAADLARACNPATMSCDPDDYVSEAAAVCIAQVAGLAAGEGLCGGHLWVNGEEGTAWWLVENMHTPNCSSGDCLEVDAVTGGFDAGSSCSWVD